MPQNLTIQLSGTTTHLHIVNAFSSVNPSEDLNLDLDFVCNNRICIESYAMVCSFVNEMRANGKTVNISIPNKKNCNSLNYASRLDFLSNLGIDFEEHFRRHNVSGKMIPLTNILPGVYDLSEEILSIFSDGFGMSDTDIEQFSFFIDEMICNSTRHSKSIAGAYFCAQKYYNCAEFVLVDSGIGIKQSLTRNELYADLDNSQAISKALEYGVTGGDGRGHGLFFTSESARRNNGEMVFLSGNNRVEIGKGLMSNKENNTWNGVLLKFKFKFDPKVTLAQLFKEAEYSSVLQ